MTNEQINQLIIDAQAELSARKSVADIELKAARIEAETTRQIEEVAIAYHASLDRDLVPGDHQAWEPPSSRVKGYPYGYVCTHNGKTWKSLIPANVWEPGDADDPQSWRWWEDLSAPMAPPGEEPYWQYGITYAVDDVVQHLGKLYECIQAHTSQPDWEPHLVAALWRLCTPAPPSGGEHPEWIEGVDYAVDDIVSYQDSLYICIMAHTAHVGAGWNPVAFPAGWSPYSE